MEARARRISWAGPALAVASVLLGVVLAEVGLRVLAPGPRSYKVWPPHLEVIFHPAPGAMPGIDGPSRFSTNALGMRGDEWGEEASPRVLALGGSTTESLYLDDRETWPQLLQDSLALGGWGPEVRVGNVGRSGLNTRHHVIQVMRLLEQHPGIDVLLLLAGVNDLHHRLSRDADYRPIDREPPVVFARLARRAFSVHPSVAPDARWWRPFELSERLARLRGAPPEGSPETLVQDGVGQIYETWRGHRRRAGAWRDALPDLSTALGEYAANLHTTAAVAQQRGVRVVFATQPVMWRANLTPEQRELLWFGGVGAFQNEPGHDYYTVDVLAQAMDRYNQTLLEVCARLGLGCVDLAGALAGETDIFYDDCHFNERGSRRVAAVFAQHLLERPSGALAWSTTRRSSP